MSSHYFFSIDEARKLAKKRLPRLVFDFIDGAAGDEIGNFDNQKALQSIKLQPRILIDVMDRVLTKKVLGWEFSLPFGIAPMGMCNLSWPNADRSLAIEAEKRNIPHILSSAGSSTLEVHKSRAGDCAWFQMYVGQSIEFADELTDRASAAGYKVLVITVDTPVVTRRIRDQRNGFTMPFKIGPKQFFDFACHPHWSIASIIAGIPKPENFSLSKHTKGFVRGESRAGTDWVFLKRLRERWPFKLIVKGVTCSDDAARLKSIGIDGIYISNHGGRQLASVPPAISLLPRIRLAVGSDYPLFFDSGIRSAEDILKAIALGADFVFLGRPFMFALGADGRRGVITLIEQLTEDLSSGLAQLGLKSMETVDHRVLFNQGV